MNNPKPCEWKSNELSRGYIADYKAFNFVDGEGVRCSLYVSGCPFHCEGCYNKAAQSFKYGKPYTKELEDDILKDIGHESVQGLTLLGGEPFKHRHMPICRETNPRDIRRNKRYLVMDRLHLGRNDARNRRQTRTSILNRCSGRRPLRTKTIRPPT